MQGGLGDEGAVAGAAMMLNVVVGVRGQEMMRMVMGGIARGTVGHEGCLEDGELGLEEVGLAAMERLLRRQAAQARCGAVMSVRWERSSQYCFVAG